MLSKEEVLKNYEEYETPLDDRFGARFCAFLTDEEMEQIGFECKDPSKPRRILKWTEKNILKQLKKDVEFAYEKAYYERGISSGLMFEVIKAWCKILQNGIALDECFEDYSMQNTKNVAEHYGWKLELSE